MKILHLLLPMILQFFICVGCKNPKPNTDGKEHGQTVSAPSKDQAKAPDTWIERRVSKAREKLLSTEAGRIVWQSMDAHGGLENWYKNGPLSFHFNYQPLDGGVQRNTYQTIDTWSLKAKHSDAKNRSNQYGWDGNDFWIKAKDSTIFGYDTRFWSLTPIYFAGQPFILDGTGVNLAKLEPMIYKDTMYDRVKVTFDPGTGDAPDDYYVLYMDAKTHRLKVIRYIVSYPGYFEKGDHLPEKFMELIGEQTISGIHFPRAYRTYWLNENELPGEHITDIDLTEIGFLPELEPSFFDIPIGAKTIDSL